MTIEQCLEILNARFVYKRETVRWFDNWKVLYDPKSDKWEGDCEDYALTLMWMLSDRSALKFMWNILVMKHLMWHVKSPNGVGHAVVKIRGLYYDNIQQRGSTKEELKQKGYKFSFPMIPPFVFVKLMLTRVLGPVAKLVKKDA